jgi:hypothetical protein
MTAELLARARAVVDYDERIAEQASYGLDVVPVTYEVTPRWATHIASWDPARVLRLCASRRVLLDQYEAALRRAATFDGGGITSEAVAAALEPWVRAIADEGDGRG